MTLSQGLRRCLVSVLGLWWGAGAASLALAAEYRLEDYRANGYAVPASPRDLWQVSPAGVEARVDNLIAFMSRADRIFSTQAVAASEDPRVLENAERPLPTLSLSPFKRITLEQWMQTHPVTGLLIMQGQQVLFERYQYGRSAQDRMLGMSMSKTLVGMLTGVALADRSIESLDDTAEKYEPRLKGHPYGASSIRSLLTMTSGMAYQESRDSAELWQRTAGRSRRSQELESVKFVRQRAFAPGQQFNYSSADTQVLALVLMAATGRKLSEYTAEKIWQPLGAEAGAFWLTDAEGREAAFMGFAATLRDWGRLGLLWAEQGRRGDRQLVPAAFLADAAASRPSGYGYQVWLPGRQQIGFFGVRGQTLLVDPASGLVMVITAAREQEQTSATAFDRERLLIWNQLRAHYAQNPR